MALKKRLKERGLPTLGNKAELIDRVILDLLGGVEEMESCKLNCNLAYDISCAYCNSSAILAKKIAQNSVNMSHVHKAWAMALGAGGP